MLRDYLIALVLLPAMVILWAVVDNLYRRFSLRHPEFRSRPEGGCGSCGSGGDGRGACHFPDRE